MLRVRALARFWVWGLGGEQGLGFRVWALGWGIGFKVSGEC